jgi:putative ABC transport system permease protein
MPALRIALAYLRARPGMTLLNVLLIGISVALVVLALQISEQAEARLVADARGIDLVLGGKGSPLQIVLSSVYHLDLPPGNIKLADAELVLADRRVKSGIRVALGDSFQGARIVGTDRDLISLYGVEWAAGKVFERPMQAVLGSDVAKRSGLGLGATFEGAHGLAEGGTPHGDHPYEVVGVLKPSGTVLDRVVLTSVESVWAVHHDHPAPARPPGAHAQASSLGGKHDHDHGHDHAHAGDDDDNREITAMLIRYATPLAAATLPREINQRPGLTAASPALEISRLLRLFGGVAAAVSAFAIILMLLAAASVFLAINASIATRRYDLALLRMLGAGRGTVVGVTMVEGTLLGALGAAFGIAAAHAGLALAATIFREARQFSLSAWQWLPQETWIVALVPLIGALAALWPAWRAAAGDVADELALQN